MGSLAAAISALSALSVTGYTNLGLPDTAPSAPDLPALALDYNPAYLQTEQVRVYNVNYTQALSIVYVDLYILTAESAFPVPRATLAADYDAYLSAIVADLFLGGAVDEPLEVAQSHLGSVAYLASSYQGVKLQLKLAWWVS